MEHRFYKQCPQRTSRRASSECLSESLQIFEPESDNEAAHETSKHNFENPIPLGYLLVENESPGHASLLAIEGVPEVVLTVTNEDPHRAICFLAWKLGSARITRRGIDDTHVLALFLGSVRNFGYVSTARAEHFE